MNVAVYLGNLYLHVVPYSLHQGSIGFFFSENFSILKTAKYMFWQLRFWCLEDYEDVAKLPVPLKAIYELIQRIFNYSTKEPKKLSRR